MNNEPLFFKTLLLKGEAGGTIDRIVKTDTVGLTDIYTIYINDGSTQEIEVKNGSSIASIEYTSSSGNVDTYTVTLTDGSTTTFNVTNGEDFTVPTDGVIYYDGDTVPDGYEETSAPSGSGQYATIDDNTASVSTTYSSSKIEQLISGIGGGGVDYSTSEQSTGLKWIDGRPIYQRTYTEVKSGINVGWNDLDSSIWGGLNGVTVLKAETAFLKINTINPQYSYYMLNIFAMKWEYDTYTPKIYSPIAISDAGTVCATIYYTKMSDTPTN